MSTPLSEWLLTAGDKAVAWDRDVRADYRWVTEEDGCLCMMQDHVPRVYDHENGAGLYVTDGHGSLFHWVVDLTADLGGSWRSYLGAVSSYVIGSGTDHRGLRRTRRL